MGFSDLLELRLNLADRVILKLLDLFECAADHAHCLWVDSGGCEYLVDLGILCLETLLDGLELLLKDQIAETCLLMKFINDLMELLKQLLLLCLQVLVLLELDFILPLLFLVLLLCFGNLLLALNQVGLDLVVSFLLKEELVDLLAYLFEWSNDKFTVVFFNKSFFIGGNVLLSLLLQVTAEGSDQVEVCLRDRSVVVLDVEVLLLVLVLELINRGILLNFDFLAFDFPLLVHLLS